MLDIKKEDVNKPSCSSVHLGVWSGSPDSEYNAVSPTTSVFVAY